MNAKIQKLIDRYNAGRLSQSSLYRRICALHYAARHDHTHF